MREKNIMAKSPFLPSFIKETASPFDFYGKKTQTHTDRFYVKGNDLLCKNVIAPYKNENLQ